MNGWKRADGGLFKCPAIHNNIIGIEQIAQPKPRFYEKVI